MRRLGSLSALFVLFTALTLAGCGDSSDGDDAKTATKGETPAAENEEASNADPEGDGAGPVDLPAEAQPYVEALRVSMTQSSDVPFAEGQAECLSTRIMSIVGVDRLVDAGITPEQLESSEELGFAGAKVSEDEGNALYDSWAACGIDLRQGMIDGMANSEAKACMEGVLTEDNLRTFMVATFTMTDEELSEDPTAAPVFGGVIGCAFMGMGDMAE